MQKIKELFIYIIMPFYIIYIYLFYMSKTRNQVDCDIDVLNKKKNRDWSCLFSLVYYLCYDEYFKVIFYHRVKDCKLRHLLYIKNKRNFVIPNDVFFG
jgi:hypothetical protein